MKVLSLKTRLAFFDIDGVLVKPWLLRRFADYLQSVGLFDSAVLATIDELLVTYKRNGNYEDLAVKGVELYAYGMKGHSIRIISEASEEFWSMHEQAIIYPHITEIARLISSRCHSIAVSGTSVEVLSPLCKRLGITDIFGTELTLDNGVFTGEVTKNRALSNSKNEIIEEYRRDHPDENIWKLSFGFGDTQQDVPLLKYVGFPYFVIDSSSEVDHTKNHEVYRLLSKEVPKLSIISSADDSNMGLLDIRRKLEALDM